MTVQKWKKALPRQTPARSGEAHPGRMETYAKRTF
jgi:hypothetical protein